MTKKTYTLIFTIVSTILNFIFTALVICAIAALATVVENRILHITDGQVYIITWMISFIAGMVLSIFLFSKITSFVVDKFNLTSKLDEKFVGKTLPNGRRNQAAYDAEASKPKTVLPDSVLDNEEE